MDVGMGAGLGRAEAVAVATRDGRGSSFPLGPTITPHGTNLSLYSPAATAVELLLFDGAEDARAARSIRLDPRQARTGPYWHAWVPGIGHGQRYGFRVDGPWAPAAGMRFDPHQVLLDPYGRGVDVPAGYDRTRASDPDDASKAMKSVLVDTGRFDWEGDRRPERRLRETVIYEAHVRGFTAHPSSGVDETRRGTYAGFVAKIPYLVDLGVTAVELLPVFHFDRLAAPVGRRNYWGYQPVAFFAPHVSYATTPDPLVAADELRELVKALHRAGIEVILDVVYNHTAESGPDGPTFAFRGLADGDYYLQGADPSTYADFSGCGNSLRAGNAVVRRLILDSLRFWVSEYHVDGFRFDLASVLSRGDDGRPLMDPPILLDIETDPVLAGTKLIAEAWDAGGLYQVGSFVGDRWVEWNGRFRDDVRSFVKGDRGYAAAVAERIMGSPDIYGQDRREPQQSVNFVTCHDGFTLNDLVSYNGKHNEANGEGNRDGGDDNRSWNCGVDGPTADPQVEALRARQARNLLAIQLLSVGMPMLTMGDEVRRTQGGNNNAYCQDSELSWFDWDQAGREAGLRRFVRELIRGRRTIQAVFGVRDETTLSDLLASADVRLSGVRFGQPDTGPDSHSIALTIGGHRSSLHLVLNAYWEALDFELPPLPDGTPWRRLVDTSLASPDDVHRFAEAPEIGGPAYRGGTAVGGPARGPRRARARRRGRAGLTRASDPLDARSPVLPGAPAQAVRVPSASKVIARWSAAARSGAGDLHRAAERLRVDRGLGRLLDDAAHEDREVDVPVEHEDAVVREQDGGRPGPDGGPDAGDRLRPSRAARTRPPARPRAGRTSRAPRSSSRWAGSRPRTPSRTGSGCARRSPPRGRPRTCAVCIATTAPWIGGSAPSRRTPSSPTRTTPAAVSPRSDGAAV